jgi:L-ascorbate metabolism protein UlaG (beta-lactamase superfamily)
MKQFGGKLTQLNLNRYASSPNWKDGKFQNLEETTMAISIQSIPKLLYQQFYDNKGRIPGRDISVLPFDKDSFLQPSDKAKIIWFGHSVLLMRINNKTLLIDPMFGPDAAPSAPFSVKRFSANTLSIIDALPPIDLMLITHDHYDHLDLVSINKLKSKTAHYYTALGVARHLSHWGINSEDITEFDWWDQKLFHDIEITFTPSRHFSGRGLSDRAKSLWGGWVFKANNENIYFSGDGGYGKHFKEVGKQLGPFDFGIMECGQYHELWHQIHMYPEESILAAIDACVGKTMAVHWGAFALAPHTWKDPINRFVQYAEKLKLELITPRIGEQFVISQKINSSWWNEYD